MKLLHTADWHLGKKLEHFSRIEEQRLVMDEICAIADAEKVDIVLVAGDLYDKVNPSNEAIELFFKTLKRLSKNGSRPVVAIAGNHDSPERILSPDPLAAACGIFLLGYPDTVVAPIRLDSGVEITQSDAGFLELKLPKFDFPLRILATPYANEYRLKKQLETDKKEEGLREILAQKWQETADKYCDEAGANILMTHLFMLKEGSTPEAEPDGEKPILIGGASAIYTNCIPAQIQYTALGHLHRFQELRGHQNPVIYSSSPLAYSFAEAGQIKKVVLLEIEPKKPVEVTPIDLKAGKPLARFTAQTVDEAVEWLAQNADAWVELKMNTPTFLTGEDTQRLKQAHSGIVGILPPDLKISGTATDRVTIDLNKSKEELFVDFFEFKNGQPPSKSILNLFKEIESRNH